MTEKTSIHFGYFQARFLPPLKSLVDHARQTDEGRFIRGCITLEPCPAGGVYLIAYSGHATAIIRDPDGYIDSPVTLDIPDAAFVAARSPQPVHMSFEGETYFCPLPEWAQPHQVCVSTGGIFITTKMRNPDWSEEHDEFSPVLFSQTASLKVHRVGQDFSLTPGAPSYWRTVLKLALDAADRTKADLYFNPVIAALLADVVDLFRGDDKSVSVQHRQPETEKNVSAIITRVEGAPDFVGLWMPLKSAEIEPLADHFLLPEARHEGTKAAQ